MPAPLETLIQPPIFVVSDNQIVTVNAGSTVVSAFSFAAIENFGYDDVSINNSGIVDGLGGIGVSNSGEGFSLINNASGYISGGFAGVDLGGFDQSVSNAGVITAGGSAIVVNAGYFGPLSVGAGEPISSTTITNTGVVYGGNVGISVGGGALLPLGVVSSGSVTIDNSGAIGGSYAGILIDDFAQNTTITNSDVIAGGQYGVLMTGGGKAFGPTASVGQVSDITNSGFISGYTAIQFSGQLDLVNLEGGVIAALNTDIGPDFTGPLNAISVQPFSGSTLDLQNDGFIDGTIDLEASFGDHIINNGGTILGDVVFGGGNDTFIGSKGSDVAGVIHGNQGNDSITGHNGNEIVFGDEGEDILRGRGGNDELFGGSENDKLIGGKGNDTLFGGEGDDRLVANQGDNTLYGGAGVDRMRGGTGVDTFDWQDANESGVLAAEQDRVINFEVGVDLINMRDATDSGELYFNASGVAGAYGVGYVQVTDDGTHSYVSLDADGDGTLDMIVQFRDTLGITIDDFIAVSELVPI